jgi:predicted RNA-binding Zn-ribbon protein involved in translation (DUF1610 family)
VKAIYEICTLWDKEICNHQDLVDLHQRINEEIAFPEPGKAELKKLNNICSLCKFPLMIKSKECPVCDNGELQRGITRGQLGVNLVYNYNCEECGRILYSYQDLD